MAIIVWDDSLSVGIDLIDEQHKKWLGHLNDVADAAGTHEGPTHIAQTLGFLVDYTDYHFGTEEKHMLASQYPDFEAHRAKHEELKKTLADLVQDYEEEGPTHELATSVVTFLANWLITHIREVDHKLAAFLKEKGVVVD